MSRKKISRIKKKKKKNGMRTKEQGCQNQDPT